MAKWFATDASFEAEQKYITEGKQEFRDKEAAEPGEGLAQAKKLLAELKDKQKKAPEKQYQESLTPWMMLMAQEDLGRYLNTITEEDMGTDMSDVGKVKTARGVLKIKVFGLSPDARLIVDPSEPPRMAGLTDAARQELKKKSINDMKIPVLAVGDNLGRLRPEPGQPEGKPVQEDFAFRVNEKGNYWGYGQPMNVKIWLQEKATGNQPLFHEHIYGPATKTVPAYVERVLAGHWKN